MPDISIEWKYSAHKKGIVGLFTKYPTRKNSTTHSWVCHEEMIFTFFGEDRDFVISIHFCKCDFHNDKSNLFKKNQLTCSLGIASR